MVYLRRLFHETTYGVVFQLDKNNSKLYKIIFFLALKPTPGYAQRLICPGILLKQCITTYENLV